MLENNARDKVYYSVRRGREILTGYTDLPQIRIDPARQEEFTFAESRYLGHEVRIVAVTRIVPQVSEPIVVQVAETLDALDVEPPALSQPLQPARVRVLLRRHEV